MNANRRIERFGQEHRRAPWRSSMRSTKLVAAILCSCALVASCGTRLPREEIVAAAGAGPSAGATAGGVSSGVGGRTAGSSPAGSSSGAGAVTPVGGGGGDAGVGGDAGDAGGGDGGGADGGAPSTDISFEAILNAGPATGEPVNVGVVGPFTGLVGASFGNFGEGVQLWAQWANEHGGLNGHPIRVFTKNDNADPAIAYSAVKSMIEENNIVALVNTTVVFPGALQAINEANIPVIGGEIISREWYRQPNLFPQGPPLQTLMRRLTDVVVQEGNEQIALYYCSEVDEICGPFRDELVTNRGIERSGGTLVHQQAVSLTSPGFTAQCLAARDGGAETVMLALDVASNARFANDCAAQNYEPRFVTFSVAANDASLEVDNLRNLLVAMPAAPWVADDTPGMAEFQAAVRQYAPNLQLGTGMVLTWISGLQAMAAARLGGMGADPVQAREQLRAGLVQLRDFDAYGTAVPMDHSTPGQPRFPDCAFFIERTPERTWSMPMGSGPSC